ncbi:MAG: hypothetical protein HYS09_08095 [Chloroflexi bacterium]|nr:hypothetical protein [Chloroflexota bacterium]
MSKLSQRIRKAVRVEAAPMGFGVSAARKPGPTMLLLARLPADDAKRLKEAAEKGADAVLFDGGDASRLKLRDNTDILWGALVPEARADTVGRLKEAGADFLAFAPEGTGADVLLDEQLGFVLAVNSDLSDAALRVLEGLPLDALLLPRLDSPLTVRRQLDLRRLYLLSRTPLLVEVPPDVEASQLRVLRESGVAGVVVDGKSGWNRLQSVRAAIDGLPPGRGRPREERAEAILPAAVAAAVPEEEEEEDY